MELFHGRHRTPPFAAVSNTAGAFPDARTHCAGGQVHVLRRPVVSRLPPRLYLRGGESRVCTARDARLLDGLLQPLSQVSSHNSYAVLMCIARDFSNEGSTNTRHKLENQTQTHRVRSSTELPLW